jgi:hypothetical protein
MNYRKISVPYINSGDIEKAAYALRKKFLKDEIPVDIEGIIEIGLKINIVPALNFLKEVGIDTLITSDWKNIYVDHDEYLDDRRSNRLRFSLAHEIGHFVLHKDIYSGFKIKTREDFERFSREIPNNQYGYLETQANKFARYLLIPKTFLEIEKKRILSRIKRDFRDIDQKTFNSFLAIPLSEVFKVSEDAMSIALNDLGD